MNTPVPAAREEDLAIPEEAFELLPEDLKAQLNALKADGLAVLESIEPNLVVLRRLIHALPTISSLRYIHYRLVSTKFEPTMEWAYENDMLTLAFVTTYVRLIDGGIGSGVARSAIPSELRSVHDSIIELRNKRYAHNDAHTSISAHLEVEFKDGNFLVTPSFEMGNHVGGALEWRPLVEFMDSLMHRRLMDQLEILKKRTGREWTFPSGPPPEWIAKVTIE